MRVVIFGASGMLGAGVLRACLLDPAVTHVLCVGRTPPAQQHEKLRAIVHTDFADFRAIESELADFDACFRLGVSAFRMKEADYRRVTYDFTLAAANALAHHSPGLVFVYVSGAGTDSTEKGSAMWARVKGQTENALFKLPFIDAYMFRPGYIQPVHGAVSKTRLYRVAYALAAPLFPLWKLLFRKHVTTNENVARAMLRVAKDGAAQRVLTNVDIETLAALPAAA
ncbi:MAG TPA: epimerase [Polyangia bacterium]